MKVYCGTLHRQGFNVIQRRNPGPGAPSIFLSAENVYDYFTLSSDTPIDSTALAALEDLNLILSDQQMPGDHGSTMLTKIKQITDANGSDYIPSIIITGNSDIQAAQNIALVILNKPAPIALVSKAFTHARNTYKMTHGREFCSVFANHLLTTLIAHYSEPADTRLHDFYFSQREGLEAKLTQLFSPTPLYQHTPQPSPDSQPPPFFSLGPAAQQQPAPRTEVVGINAMNYVAPHQAPSEESQSACGQLPCCK